MKTLFILFCIAYIAGFDFWLMHKIDRFTENGGFRPPAKQQENKRILRFPYRDNDRAA